LFLTVQKASKSSLGLKVLPLGGTTRVTWQEKFSVLVPPPLLVNVGTTREVGVESTKMNVAVAVGRGVSVTTVGVSVGLGVVEGRTAAVCVEAALTVCAMNVPTAPESIVGTMGVASEGTQAMINASAVTQINNFDLRGAVIISSSTCERDRRSFFNDDGYIWKT
jgi:hypothetical protein